MPTARRQLIVITVVVLLAAVAVVSLFTARGDDGTSASDAAESASSSGRTLDTVDGIRLAAFGSDDEIDLASFGEPLVVNYWASWCLFCIEEMPAFQSVYEDVKGDVAFLGVNIQDDESQAKRLLKLTGVKYPHASDPNGDVFQKLRSRSMPTTVFVDETGGILERFSGPLTAAELRERIREHFGV